MRGPAQSRVFDLSSRPAPLGKGQSSLRSAHIEQQAGALRLPAGSPVTQPREREQRQLAQPEQHQPQLTTAKGTATNAAPRPATARNSPDWTTPWLNGSKGAWRMTPRRTAPHISHRWAKGTPSSRMARRKMPSASNQLKRPSRHCAHKKSWRMAAAVNLPYFGINHTRPRGTEAKSVSNPACTMKPSSRPW